MDKRPGISQPFNFLGDFTELGVTKMKPKLLCPALDGILPREPMGDGDRPLQSEISRINDFISSRIEHDCFGVHPGFMSKTGLARDVIVEGNLDPDNVGNHRYPDRKASRACTSSRAPCRRSRDGQPIHPTE